MISLQNTVSHIQNGRSIMDKIKLFNIQHFSLYDGPGIRTVLFFKGCPLNCVWCHNPESKSQKTELAYHGDKCAFCSRCAVLCPNSVHTVSADSHEIDRNLCVSCGKCVTVCGNYALELFGKEYTIDEIIAEVKKDDMFFTDDGGVTISGGEPFMQYEGLLALARRCRDEGYSVCIETSGFTSADKLTAVSQYVDLFLYDYKLTNPEEHKKYVGADNKVIIENLSVLDKVGAKAILRCPIIPDINDTEEHFKGIAATASAHGCITSVELMPYHPLGISKSQKIGKECPYWESEFLSKDTANTYAEAIQKLTEKKVTVSG